MHSVFVAAMELLLRRRDILGTIGESGVVDRIAPLSDAVRAYEAYEKGECGKVVFDPWT